jgi:4-carboxymuconolactone decarboxylase
MSRLRRIPRTEMSADQLSLVDRSGKGRDRAKLGPFLTWLHRPELAKKMAVVMPYWHQMEVDYGLSEMATAMVARAWKAQYAWYNHAAQAVENGVDREVMEAIKDRRKPVFKKPGEEVVYAVVTELLETRGVSDATYDRAREVLGEAGLIDIVQVAGFYTLVSMNEATFGSAMPEGVPPPLAG